MKHAGLKICFLLTLLSFNKAYTQKVDFQQYYATAESQLPPSQGIVGYKGVHNWYSEARFNYEDVNTASLYGGKLFSHKGSFSTSITPMLGIVFGRFNGGSLATNFEIEYKKFDFSTQAQYTFSTEDNNLNYTYNWSELTADITNWFYAGLTSQQTLSDHEKPVFSNGIVTGFSFGKFTFPVYLFLHRKSSAFLMLGLNWEWSNTKQ